MAAKWCEGFEKAWGTPAAGYGRKYDQTGGTLTVTAKQTGRVHGAALGVISTVLVTPSLGLSDTLVMGMAVRVNGSTASNTNNSNSGLYFERAGVQQVRIEIVNSTDTFQIRLMRGATQLAISDPFDKNIWHYFEAKITFHTSTGAYEIRHNEVTILSDTGVNTANSGSNQADIFAWRWTGTLTAILWFDDMYLLDTTGSVNNDFLGDSIIEEILPDGAGATTQWTPSAGSNFQNVDDGLSDSGFADTGTGGNNSSDTDGQQDLYEYQDLTQTQGDIHFILVNTQLAMAAAGTRDVEILYRDPDTTVEAVDEHSVALSTYDSFPTALDENPISEEPWDIADIQNGQFGVGLPSA